MKATLILALPAMALAAATPPTIEERQLPGLGGLLNVQCLQRIVNIDQCFPNLGSGATPTLGNLLACITDLPTILFSVPAALGCLRVPLSKA
ncbi:hypothetical protein FSPOR_5827 [Fusarium sporotrichioides]|uniref:Hydrophobin n=1 Tax=Fusarium sporotrichioides TaxID=5514 RepID=A0A395S6G5_FUSSP|nr:hypothetical protein FSPOR_5827 [Fusarium sporotrichioides]